MHPVGRTELRSPQGEGQAEGVIGHGQERGEDRVGAGGQTVQSAGPPGPLHVPDLLEYRRRGPSVGPAAGDDVEHVQAGPAVLALGRGVDDDVGVDEEGHRPADPVRSSSTSRSSSPGDRKRPRIPPIPSTARRRWSRGIAPRYSSTASRIKAATDAPRRPASASSRFRCSGLTRIWRRSVYIHTVYTSAATRPYS